MPRIRILALLLAAAPLAHGEVYKWVDEKGVVNYGGTPPPGSAAKALPSHDSRLTVVPAPPPPSIKPAPSPSTTDKRVEELEKALAEEKAARHDRESRELERLKSAIADCEANKGIDCEGDPYQRAQTFILPRQRFIPQHPHPKPPPQPKPRELEERKAPAAGQPIKRPQK